MGNFFGYRRLGWTCTTGLQGFQQRQCAVGLAGNEDLGLNQFQSIQVHPLLQRQELLDVQAQCLQVQHGIGSRCTTVRHTQA